MRLRHEEQAGLQGLRHRGTVTRAKGWGILGGFSVEEHEAGGIMETEFYLPNTFSTHKSALEAALQAGWQKIDVGFERGSVVVNG